MNLQVGIEINAACSEVFALFTDIPHWADNIPAITNIEMHTDGDVAIGTKFTETRIMFGKEAQETMTVTALESERLLVLDAENHGTRYVSTHRFEAADDRTKVSFEFTAEPLTMAAKVFSCIGLLFKGAMETAIRKDFEALKTIAESRPDAAN